MKGNNMFFALILLIPLLSDAQCRPWTKSQCFPWLDGFVQYDNYNTATMSPGQSEELLLTFFGNREYRLLICTHPVLGNVGYEIMDIYGGVIHKSDTYTSPTFDFKMANTQQLKVLMHVPENEYSDIANEGCLSIMVGFKKALQ